MQIELQHKQGRNLTEQIVQQLMVRIDDKILHSGARLPSIRQFAQQNQVSCATVVQAYDRLVGRGYLESRRGAGFFVRARETSVSQLTLPAAPPQMDVVWLVRAMFHQGPAGMAPGSGLLPLNWLDAGLLGQAMRKFQQPSLEALIHYGHPQGYLPLRQQLQLKLAELEIACPPQQVLTTAGITQGLDLIAREFARPGDTVFVDDPAWFLMFGSFAAMGLKVIGIPRLHDGPDMAQLEHLAQVHQPRFFVINSILHNPTSFSLSPAKAFRLLQLAQKHDFLLVEDDIYCDMHPGVQVQSATRLASLDQLQRVIYMGSFGKTLAANLRVGFIAAAQEHIQRLTDRKVLASLTSSELGERIVYKILSEGLYRKHVERIRNRLQSIRQKSLRALEKAGFTIGQDPCAGMFLWLDAAADTNQLALKAHDQGILLAPGALFSPHQLPSTRLRINLTNVAEPKVLAFFEKHAAKSARQTAQT
ncbi:PLP-dependent aminotransferase family protein [Massilia sp. W12]|uniref:aminotransferase-like domain-containing protein n=1 Tax=Massilia sp. W12 TaxID=3126507 RepID=UPI0030D1BD70